MALLLIRIEIPPYGDLLPCKSSSVQLFRAAAGTPCIVRESSTIFILSKLESSMVGSLSLGGKTRNAFCTDCSPF